MGSLSFLELLSDVKSYMHKSGIRLYMYIVRSERRQVVLVTTLRNITKTQKVTPVMCKAVRIQDTNMMRLEQSMKIPRQ